PPEDEPDLDRVGPARPPAPRREVKEGRRRRQLRLAGSCATRLTSAEMLGQPRLLSAGAGSAPPPPRRPPPHAPPPAPPTAPRSRSAGSAATRLTSAERLGRPRLLSGGAFPGRPSGRDSPEIAHGPAGRTRPGRRRLPTHDAAVGVHREARPALRLPFLRRV